MKHLAKLTFGVMFMMLSLLPLSVLGQNFRAYSTAVWVEKNGAGTFYNTYSSSTTTANRNYSAQEHAINQGGGNWQDPSITFQNQDFGAHIANSGTLLYRGNEVKTLKTDEGNVCKVEAFYVIYPQGNRPTTPNFIPADISWFNNCDLSQYLFPDIPGQGPCNQSPNYQKWQSAAEEGVGYLTTNVVENLTARYEGKYTLELYHRVTGGNTTTTCDVFGFDNNNGSPTNYTSNFTICPTISLTSKSDPAVCGGNGEIIIAANGIEDGTYSDRFYYTDSNNTKVFFSNVVVANNVATITVPAGVYNNIFYFVTTGCEETGGFSVTLTDPAAPTAPGIGNITNPNCTTPTGSVVLTGLPATGTWTITSAPDNKTYTGTGTSTTISGLAIGVSYTFNVTNAAGCSSVFSKPVTLQPVACLSVEKTVDNPTPRVGSNVVFTIKVSNNGPSAATNVVVNDILETGYTFVSSDATVGSYNDGTGVWGIGTLTNGSTATLKITAKVNVEGNYTNTATVRGAETDPNQDDNTSTTETKPIPVANLNVVKTVNTNTPLVGSNVTFTIKVTNNGPSTATNVIVNDLLKSGYTYVSHATLNGTYVPNTGIWTIGTLNNGASVTLTITAKVNPAGDYSNTAEVKGTEEDPDLSDNTSTVTPGANPIADLAVIKTVDNENPKVGDNVVFTIKVTNSGPSTATNVVVNDILETGYTFISSDATVGNYNNGTGVWGIGTLTSGSTATLTITAKVNVEGNYTNTATVRGAETDPNQDDNTSTTETKPTPVANLNVVKTVNTNTPIVGSNVTFTIKVTNNGPSTATNVIVNDLLKSGYTYVSHATLTGTYVPNTGIWTIGTLNNGASVTLTITAKVNPAGDYSNTAEVKGTEEDPDLSDNTSTVTPGADPIADLTVLKTVDNPTPEVGMNVVFTIKVRNNGPSTATNVTAEDVLKSGYSYISNSTSTGTYDSMTGIWEIGTLNSNAEATLTITAKVNPTGDYSNTAITKATEKDPNENDNTSTTKTDPVPLANLAIAKTVDNSTPAVGSNVVFTIKVTNNGPSAATNVTVDDLLKSGYDYVSNTFSAGAYNITSGVWTVGTLNNGATATLTITAKVKAEGDYSNTATTTATEKDPDTTDNTVTIKTDPNSNADLGIEKVADNMAPLVGSEVIFNIKVTNFGPSKATGVKVNERIASGYTYTSHSASAGDYSVSSGIWDVGEIEADGTATLSIKVKVNESGDYTNTVTVRGNEPDPNPTNNTVTIETEPDILVIPDGFSPNGDSYNEYFEIVHSPNYKIELSIYNRWGNLLYESKDYQNDWRGEGIGGRDVPDGTYYRIIKVTNSRDGKTTDYAGYLTIKR